MGNVSNLPPSSFFTPEQALHSARNENLESVLILGYDEKESLVILTSRIERKDALWLLEEAKLYIMGEEK